MSGDYTAPILSESSTIPLEQMRQRALVQTADDDWTGVVDRVERRRLQNRLNQRSYRSRRRQPKNTNIAHANNERSEGQLVHIAHNVDFRPSTSTLNSQPWIYNCKNAPPHAHQVMLELEATAIQTHMLGTPNIDHLLSLSRLNIQRAVNENTTAIGISLDWLIDDDSISVFNVNYPGFSETHIPASLRPTALQRSKPHHPWLDVFPFPQMRDNLIAMEDYHDDTELCRDLMAFWDTRNAGPMLLVWGSSVDPNNWEVSEAFVEKWGWVIAGCKDILDSTNRWRNFRGEKRLRLPMR